VSLSLFPVREGEQGESIFVYCEGGRAGLVYLCLL